MTIAPCAAVSTHAGSGTEATKDRTSQGLPEGTECAVLTSCRASRDLYHDGDKLIYEALHSTSALIHAGPRRSLQQSGIVSGFAAKLEYPHRWGVHVFLVFLGLFGFELRAVELRGEVLRVHVGFFLGKPLDDLFKIGKTSNSLERRRNQLQTGCPSTLTLLRSVSTATSADPLEPRSKHRRRPSHTATNDRDRDTGHRHEIASHTKGTMVYPSPGGNPFCGS